MSADQLFDALWSELPPASASKIVQGCVVRLRKVLGRGAIQTSPHGYTLRLPTEDVDSLRFEDQVGRVRELLTLGEADRAAYLLTDALALWRGAAFVDLESWEPAVAAGTRLSELRLEAEELRIDALRRAGRYREVLSEAQVLVRAASLREYRWVLLARTGKLIRDRDLLDDDVLALAYVNGDRDLLMGTTLGQTIVVDAETLRPRGEPFDIATHKLVPIGDGSTAMVQEESADVTSLHWRVIDVSTGEVLSEGDLAMRPTASVSSPDGSTVAVAGDTGDLTTIDVSTGDERRSTSLGAKVLWLDYSDDGELLVSGADDGGVSLWDATTLDLLGTVYPPHLGDPVPAAAQFIGDSHDVAIASYDGKVYQWDTDVDRAMDFACQMAGRDLTKKEWDEFLPAQPYRSVCPGG